jgi:hypothetical protein
MNGIALRGPESIAAAQQLREEIRAKSQWPFPWVFPPPGAIRVTAGADSSGTLIVPAVATPTQGLLYTVDEGFLFAPDALVVEYLNDGVRGDTNPGDFLWSMTLNSPVGVGNFQGSPIQGFTAVDVPLGTLQIPWPVGCDIYSPNDAIRIVVTNVNLSTGAPNYIKSILRGWTWPAG